MVKRIFSDLKKYRHYAFYAARADLRTEVADSYLNWIWWILDPLCMMLIYTFVFGVVFKISEPYFPIFVFIGLTTWEFFSRGINNSVINIKVNRNIISKVYIPKYILLIEKMMVHAFKMFISFGIVIAMMIFYRVPPSINWLYVPLIILDLFMMTFAIGVHLQHFGVYVSDLKNLTQIVLKMVFYLTGVFYNIEKRIPGRIGSFLLNSNPTALILDSLRKALIYDQTPHVWKLIIILLVSIVIAYIGIVRIYKYENSYAKVV